MRKLDNIRLMLVMALFLGFISCEDEDKIPKASYQPAVWFYASTEGVSSIGNMMDRFDEKFSGSYSFYFHQEVETDTFALAEIRLLGMPADYDRKVNLVSGEGSTAVEGEHFEIVDNVLPAHAVSFTPKVLLIKKNLGEDEKVIKFVLKPSGEFPAQVVGDTVSEDKTFYVSLRYELKFSNHVAQPPYWKQCSFYFGTWSRVKYEFMIEKLGRYWGVEPLSPSDMNDLNNDYLRIRRIYKEWQDENGGKYMIDENGNSITF